MSRFVSALKRLSDNDLTHDVCAFVCMAAFLAGMAYGSAGISLLVAGWRLGQ